MKTPADAELDQMAARADAIMFEPDDKATAQFKDRQRRGAGTPGCYRLGNRYYVKLYLCRSQTTLGKFDRGQDAARFADAAIVFFWKYRTNGPLSPTDCSLTFTVESANRDLANNAPLKQLLERMELHLLSKGYITPQEEVVLKKIHSDDEALKAVRSCRRKLDEANRALHAIQVQLVHIAPQYRPRTEMCLEEWDKLLKTEVAFITEQFIRSAIKVNDHIEMEEAEYVARKEAQRKYDAQVTRELDQLMEQNRKAKEARERANRRTEEEKVAIKNAEYAAGTSTHKEDFSSEAIDEILRKVHETESPPTANSSST